MKKNNIAIINALVKHTQYEVTHSDTRGSFLRLPTQQLPRKLIYSRLSDIGWILAHQVESFFFFFWIKVTYLHITFKNRSSHNYMKSDYICSGLHI